MTCICNKNGTWPHIKCNEELKSLSQNKEVKNSCEPNTYVQVECNVCRCDPEGNVDENHCTKNECDGHKSSSRRQSDDNNKLYGDCESGTWYSLAPCQFCYCVNINKLVCNTGTRSMANKIYLQLGAYSLNICGKGLGKELRDMENENQILLRQGNEIDKVDQQIELSSPKPNFFPKPSVQPAISKTHMIINVDKDNKVKEPSKNNQNIVADNTSSESDDSKQEQDKGLEIKNDIIPYKDSTKLPYDDEEEYEASAQSQEETVVSARDDSFEKITEKQKTYHEQRIAKPEPHYEVNYPEQALGRQENYDKQELERQKVNNKHALERQKYNKNVLEWKDNYNKYALENQENYNKHELEKKVNYHDQAIGRKEDYKEKFGRHDIYPNLQQPIERKGNFREQIIERQDQEEDKEESDSVEPIGKNELKIAVNAVEDSEDPTGHKHKVRFDDVAFNMQVNLPSVIGTVLKNLAARRSMVTLNPNKKCTPGTIDVIECNTCFCLNNAKLLCTAKKCD
ncbi:unnamed protein product [Diatraea saccharalis]|uniref:Pacifastin domain-containing protein n=1 Tax=Diatraea saccharalis TaxID=40085 RepID=A0A9N9RAN7_9NEOP|nr:unnamed protein product [Diatraea saccharalis]